ncbi:MAG: hypothetical protein ACI9OD_001103 [Limisphaerales bacterium]|jgi:hypothetical protein
MPVSFMDMRTFAYMECWPSEVHFVPRGNTHVFIRLRRDIGLMFTKQVKTALGTQLSWLAT